MTRCRTQDVPSSSRAGGRLCWIQWSAVVRVVCLVGTTWTASRAAAGLPVTPPTRQEVVRFEAEILPILAANCTACHNGKVREGGLMLDSVKAILAGGDSGPAAVAGKPADSLLFLRATHRKDDAMPPADNKVGAKNLSPEQLGLLERWIAEGATAGPVTARLPIAWQPLPAAAGGVVAVAITTDGRTTAAARGNQVDLFDTPSGRLLATLVDPRATAGNSTAGRAHLDVVSSLAFNVAGDRLATGSFRTIKLWRRRAPARIAEIAGSAQATAVAVASSSGIVAIGLADGRILVCEVGGAVNGRILRTIHGHTAGVTALAFSADAATLHSAGRDGAVLSTRTGDGQAVGRLVRNGVVRALAALAGETRLAVAEADNTVRIWALPLPGIPAAGAKPPAASGPLAELGGMPQPTTVIVGMPTMSGHLLTAGGDGVARLWNAEAKSVVRQFVHGGAIVGMAMRSDGARLATVGTVPGVKLWDASTAALIAEPKGDPRLADRQRTSDIAIATDKQDVEFATTQATAAEKAVQTAANESQQAAEKVVAAEKTATEKTVAAAAATKSKAEADALAAQAMAAVPVATEVRDTATKVAAAASATATAAEVSLAHARRFAPDQSGAEAIKGLESAAAAATAARAAADQAVVQATQQVDRAKARADETTKQAIAAGAATDAAEEARKQADTGVTSAKRAVEFAAEQGQRSAADVPLRKADLAAAAARLAADEGTRKTLDAEAAASAKPCVAVAFSADGAWLACAGVDGRIEILDAKDGRPRLTWDGGRPALTAGTPVAISFAVGSKLLVAGAAAPATVWEMAESWSLERTIGGELTPPATDDAPGGPPVDIVTALAFSPDGSLVASGGGRASRSGEIKLWKVADGSLVRALPLPHSDTVMAVEFSRRGDLLASGAADRFLKVHAVADGRHVRSFEGHTGHVLGVAWQANGRRLASAGADNAVKVWEYLTGEQQRTIPGASKEVTAVRFVDAGEELVAASATPSLRLMNAGSGAVVREFPDCGDFVQSLAVAGPFIAAGAQDGTLRIWNLASGSLLHTLAPGAIRPQ